MDLAVSSAPPKPTGRPTLFSPDVQATILAKLGEGLPMRLAAQLAGVSYDALNGWLRRAEQPDADPSYVQFSQNVQRARAQAQQAIAGKWRNAFDTDWKAAQRYLATVYPEDWAQEQRVQVNHTGGPTVNIAVLSMDMLPAIAGLLGAPPADVIDNDLQTSKDTP